MSPETKDRVQAALLVGALFVMPCIFVFQFISGAQQIVAKGEVEATFWLPKNAEVITDTKEYWREHKERSPLYISLAQDRYKEIVPEDVHHKILLTETQVSYWCQQGIVEINSTYSLRAPRFVTVKEFRYLGGGKVRWTVASGMSTYDYIAAIVAGILAGIMIGVVAIIIICALTFVVYLIVEKIRGY